MQMDTSGDEQRIIPLITHDAGVSKSTEDVCSVTRGFERDLSSAFNANLNAFNDYLSWPHNQLD